MSKWLSLPFISNLKRIKEEPWPEGQWDIEISPMVLADIDAILQIEKASFTTPWSRKAFVAELSENHYAHYLCARLGERVIGYGGMWLVLDEAHITNIAVGPRARGHGVGRRLLEGLLATGYEKRCLRYTLEVRRSNIIAQKLYESCNFQQKGVRFGYYTDNYEDAFIMVREELPDAFSDAGD